MDALKFTYHFITSRRGTCADDAMAGNLRPDGGPRRQGTRGAPPTAWVRSMECRYYGPAAITDLLLSAGLARNLPPAVGPVQFAAASFCWPGHRAAAKYFRDYAAARV